MDKSIILHSTPLKEFRDMIGMVIEEKLSQHKPEPPKTTTDSEYLTRKEACKLLRISLCTLHSFTKKGTVKGYHIGGRILYKTEEVRESVKRIQETKYKHGRG